MGMYQRCALGSTRELKVSRKTELDKGRSSLVLAALQDLKVFVIEALQQRARDAGDHRERPIGDNQILLVFAFALAHLTRLIETSAYDFAVPEAAHGQLIDAADDLASGWIGARADMAHALYPFTFSRYTEPSCVTSYSRIAPGVSGSKRSISNASVTVFVSIFVLFIGEVSSFFVKPW